MSLENAAVRGGLTPAAASSSVQVARRAASFARPMDLYIVRRLHCWSCAKCTRKHRLRDGAYFRRQRTAVRRARADGRVGLLRTKFAGVNDNTVLIEGSYAKFLLRLKDGPISAVQCLSNGNWGLNTVTSIHDRDYPSRSKHKGFKRYFCIMGGSLCKDPLWARAQHMRRGISIQQLPAGLPLVFYGSRPDLCRQGNGGEGGGDADGNGGSRCGVQLRVRGCRVNRLGSNRILNLVLFFCLLVLQWPIDQINWVNEQMHVSDPCIVLQPMRHHPCIAHTLHSHGNDKDPPPYQNSDKNRRFHRYGLTTTVATVAEMMVEVEAVAAVYRYYAVHSFSPHDRIY